MTSTRWYKGKTSTTLGAGSLVNALGLLCWSMVNSQVTLVLLASKYLKDGRISMDVLNMRNRLINSLR